MNKKNLWEDLGRVRLRSTVFRIMFRGWLFFRHFSCSFWEKKNVFSLFAWSTFSNSLELGWNGWKQWVPSADLSAGIDFRSKCSALCCVIRHLHISHNAPYLPPKILHNLCSSFPLGITVVPREIENNAYEKFWDANKMHYGRCASGVSTNFTLLKNLPEVLAWVLLKTCKQITKAVFMHIVQLQKHLKNK